MILYFIKWISFFSMHIITWHFWYMLAPPGALSNRGAMRLYSCSCCFTSMEARWPIRDGDRVGRGWQSEGSTTETARKRPERPWTATRTMEVLRRCPLAIAQRLVHCAIAVSTAVLGQSQRQCPFCILLMNNLDNSKKKRSNLLSPAPPPYSWSLLGKLEGPAPPPSSKISWSFDLLQHFTHQTQFLNLT